MKLTIFRWDSAVGRFRATSTRLTQAMDVCARETHQFCHHSPETVVFRSHEITGVFLYPNLKEVRIYTAKRGEKLEVVREA